MKRGIERDKRRCTTLLARKIFFCFMKSRKQKPGGRRDWDWRYWRWWDDWESEEIVQNINWLFFSILSLLLLCTHTHYIRENKRGSRETEWIRERERTWKSSKRFFLSSSASSAWCLSLSALMVFISLLLVFIFIPKVFWIVIVNSDSHSHRSVWYGDGANRVAMTSGYER